MEVSNIFVFVACGSGEHTQTLNFSLRYLKYFSKKKIIVVTDLSRNEDEIDHENIIDVKTPEALNNHQASIYLKTSLHKILAKGNLYCYLDTDVIAISEKANRVFEQFRNPLLFATDHCTMKKFSPNAVNCGCTEKHAVLVSRLNELFEEFDLNRKIKDNKLKEKGKHLRRYLETMRKTRVRQLQETVRFYFSGNQYKLENDFIYHKNEKYWTDADGYIICYDQENLEKKIEGITGLTWEKNTNTWKTNEGNSIRDSKCHHLKEAIATKFGINIETEDFQHWNGGVFLFDDNSHEFLEAWHTKTMDIFNDPYWKTRDQGTLIATAWEFGIQHQETLPVEFNFIADYNHPTMLYKGNFTFDVNDKRKNIRPYLIHIYHHWGDEDWNIWQDVSTMNIELNAS